MVLSSQVCTSIHQLCGRENVRLVSMEPLITNTPEEGYVLVMVTDPFFQTAGAVLQKRVSDWPIVLHDIIAIDPQHEFKARPPLK